MRKAYDAVPRYAVSVWEERDRLVISVYDDFAKKEVASWSDDDAREMFTDGFFRRGRDLPQSVIDYLASVDVVEPGATFYTD